MLKIFLLLLLIPGITAAQLVIPAIEFDPEKYICYRTDQKMGIDGRLNEDAWEKAEWTKDFIDIEGTVKPLPRFRTRAKMLWDDDYFYVAAELEEPDLWATLVNRDDIIFYDNDFEVFIDPDGDTHNYAELEINIFNTVWDLFLIKPYRDADKAALHGWDIKGLKSGVKYYGTLNQPGDKDSGWTVEIAFPWNAFKEITSANVPPQNNDQWRINFSRVEWKTEVKDGKYRKQINPRTDKNYPEDNWVWSPQGLINMHYPEMWGYVQFSEERPGNKETAFIEDPAEKSKWLLRRIYYAEKKYFIENGKYTDKIEELKISVPESGNIMIKCTDNMFEAAVRTADGIKVIIFHDGLINVNKGSE